MATSEQQRPRRAGRDVIDKLLNAYQQQQITWGEMQQRFDELINLHADLGGPRRPRQPIGRPARLAAVWAGKEPQAPTGSTLWRTAQTRAMVAEIRPIGWDEPLPHGWQAASIRWRGEDVEVAYDPVHVSAVLVVGEAQGSERRYQLAECGWLPGPTDETGSQLWLKDRTAAAEIRLDEVRNTSASIGTAELRHEPPELSL